MAWYHRLSNVFRGDRLWRDVDQELAFHIQERIDELRDSGLSATDAERQARRQFGNLPLKVEETIDMDVWRWLEDLRSDLRIGARTLLRRPGFALTVILTLAVGIGANVAVFSVVHAVLIRPFAYPAHEPDRVLRMAERSPQGQESSVSYVTFHDWVEQLESFETLSGVMQWPFTWTGPDGPVSFVGRATSAAYFGLHGIQPLHGRLYDTTDDRFGGSRVVVLTHWLWQVFFCARSDVVG